MPDKIRIGRNFENVAQVCTECSRALTQSELFRKPGAKMVELAKLGHTLPPHECLEITLKTGLETGKPIRCDCSCHQHQQEAPLESDVSERKKLAEDAFYGRNQPLMEHVLHARGYWKNGQFFPADGLSLNETFDFVQNMSDADLTRYKKPTSDYKGYSNN